MALPSKGTQWVTPVGQQNSFLPRLSIPLSDLHVPLLVRKVRWDYFFLEDDDSRDQKGPPPAPFRAIFKTINVKEELVSIISSPIRQD